MLFFILLSIILFFFCLYFYYSIQKLKQQIIKLEQETKTILERKIINTKEDKISIDNISVSNTKDLSEDENKIMKEEVQEKYVPLESISSKKYIARTTNQEYQEPIIKTPITTTLTREFTKINDDKKQSTKTLTITTTFDPLEFIKKDNEINISNNNKEIEYLEEIAKKIENELIPQTIDLTDYEKNQEEQAVISYQELLNLKEKSNIQEEQDKIFLEDLKALRNLLESNKYK